MNINKYLTTINYSTGSSTSRIKYIVIHYTANDGDTAYGNAKYFATAYRGASAHYFVDESNIYQVVEDKNIAWHCGTNGKYYHAYCRNTNSLGVELCSEKYSNGTYYFNEETVSLAVELVKSLMAKYNVPISNVIRHYDVTHKVCPAPFVNDVSQWTKFKERLVATTSATEEEEADVVETINININGKTYSVQRILNQNENYIRLSDFKKAGFNVGYNAESKVPSIGNAIKELPILVDGETNTTINAVNISDYNYAQIRDLASAIGGIEVGYDNGTVTLNHTK